MRQRRSKKKLETMENKHQNVYKIKENSSQPLRNNSIGIGGRLNPILPILSSETQLQLSPLLSSDDRDEVDIVEKENADGAGEMGSAGGRLLRTLARRVFDVTALSDDERSLFGENDNCVRSPPFEGDKGIGCLLPPRPVSRAKKALFDEAEVGISFMDASVELENRDRSSGIIDGSSGWNDEETVEKREDDTSDGTRDLRGSVRP